MREERRRRRRLMARERRAALAELLREEGYIVETAADGLVGAGGEGVTAGKGRPRRRERILLTRLLGSQGHDLL
jgi:hypothetical protein